MYLDLFDELKLNKRLVRIVGFDTAAYWAELQSILKQVVKKGTADEQGFFILDRDFMERETTLTVVKQLKCDEKLISLGVMLKDPENPNKISIAVNGMVALITDEDTTRLKKSSKSTTAEAKVAKQEGIKATMKRAILEKDPELRYAYERWVDGMIDAQNCKFTKAVVQVFEKTVTEYTQDKSKRLKIIEIATTNSYKDATWAISRLSRYRTNDVVKPVTQKIGSAVDDTIVF